MSNDYELLSKKQVMDEYGYPEWQLTEDLRSGKVPAFKMPDSWGRWYIPRLAVEKRIRELAKMGAKK